MSKTSVFKRGLTAFMAMLLCLSSFIGLGTTTAYAAGEQAEVYMISFPRDGDANYGGDWGHPNLHYMNGWTSGSSNKTTIRAMGSYTGIACYCIEPGVTQNTGDVLTLSLIHISYFCTMEWIPLKSKNSDPRYRSRISGQSL